MFTNFSKLAFSAVAIAIFWGLMPLEWAPGRCHGQEGGFDSERAVAEFKKASDEWRDVLTEINAVTIRYQNATDSQLSELRQRHRELESQARLQFRDLFGQAVKITQQSPGVDGDVTDFLSRATQYRFNRDNYEMTGEAAEALMQVLEQGRGLPEIAGVSYWATNQHERARPFLEQAVGMGLLDEKSRGVLESLERLEQAWKVEQEKLEAEAKANDLPRVSFQTTRGEIVVELFENEAPNTVANFIRLVEEGTYRNIPFYQVLAGRVALAGDVRVDPATMGFVIADENKTPDARAAFRGYLAMTKLPTPPESVELKTYPNSASSHFFMTYRPIMGTNAEHTIFGRIIEGIEHFTALTRVDPSKEKKEGEEEEKPDYILEAEVIRKRPHDYEPNRIDISALGGGTSPP